VKYFAARDRAAAPNTLAAALLPSSFRNKDFASFFADTLKAGWGSDSPSRKATAWPASDKVRAGLQEAGSSWQYPARSSSRAGREFIMNEQVINLIVKRTGITQENAEKSVLVVFDFLKTKLPAPIASQLEPFLSGGVLAGRS
jgi:hypothetical protein